VRHRWILLQCGLLAALTLAGQTREQQLRQAFETGEQAMRSGDLATAEKSFRQVLAQTPADVGALVNLGVVYSREEKWKAALTELEAAQKLAPGVPGISLNIGLAYYRQSAYARAIPPFEAVLKAQPDSAQARRLLGLCYLFELRYAEATRTLEPLWEQSNSDISYLYALAVSAANSGRADLDQKALTRLLEVGKGSPAVDLLLGKAYLAHDEDDQALEAFEKAAAVDPKLPMLHYHLGVIYNRRHELARAEKEFREDIALEPNVPYDYDQLGAVCAAQEEFDAARAAFEKAVQLDPRIARSWYGLAKIEKDRKHYTLALKDLQAAGEADPKSPSVHYMRSRVLAEMGRKAEAQAELLATRKLQQETESRLEQEISGKYRDPQIAEPQK
jgi:tetratricopeptide (TPR) repeat protein